MRNALFVAIMTSILTLTASAAPAVPAVFQPDPSFMKKPAHANPFRFNENWDISGYWYNSCNGEYVYVTGSIHINYGGTYNDKTNELKYNYHINYQNASGVGQSTGNKYRFIETFNQQVGFSYDGCTLTIHSVQTYKLNAAGSGDSFIGKVNVAYSYNYCTGVYDIKRDSNSYECK